MKPVVHTIKYDAVKMWLLALSLTLAPGVYVWQSELATHYGRAFLDLVNRRVDPKVTWSTAIHDVVTLGYPLLRDHKKKIHHESGCAGKCTCAHPCSCNMSEHDEYVTEPFTGLEKATGITGDLLIFGLLAGLLAGWPSWLILSPIGIRFPWYMTFGLLSVPSKRWSKLTSATIKVPTNEIVADDQFDKTKIIFKFGKLGNASVQLGKIPLAVQTNFLKGLDEWVDKERKSPELEELLRRHLDSDTKSAEVPTFTALWEEELGTHMAATNFVPLAKGTDLQYGRFRIFSILSSGGLSAVYLAEAMDKSLVVLKESVIPQHLDEAIKAKAHELFEREASLLKKLDHPKIAKVLDHFRECGRDYLVLEYLPGRNLRQVVKLSGPQDEGKVLKWAAEIGDILQYLHGLEPPIIHRDLTPDNILLKSDGSIAVIDFGAANEYLGTATGTLIGKQSYISPEQFKGKATPGSDIYALGCTLFFLLTGDDPEALSVSHPKEIKAELSNEIDAIVASCTELEDQERTNLQSLIQRIQSLHSKNSKDNDAEQLVPSSQT